MRIILCRWEGIGQLFRITMRIASPVIDNGGNMAQVPHLCVGALARIVGYSSQERPRESAAPVPSYNAEVMKMYGY